MSKEKRSATAKVLVHGKAKPTLRYKSPPVAAPVIGSNDIVFGRGPFICAYNGNMQYRRIVCRYKKSYQMSRKVEKQVVIKKVLDEIKKLDPPGRFVEVTKRNQLIPVTCQARIYEKISQALRDKKNCTSFEVKDLCDNVMSCSDDGEEESSREFDFGGVPEKEAPKPRGAKKWRPSRLSRAFAWPPPLTAKEVAKAGTDEEQERTMQTSNMTEITKSSKGRVCKSPRAGNALTPKKRISKKKSKGSKKSKTVTKDKSSITASFTAKTAEALNSNEIGVPGAPNSILGSKVYEYSAAALSEQADHLFTLERAVCDNPMDGLSNLQENFELFKFPLEKATTWKNDFLDLDAEEVLPSLTMQSHEINQAQPLTRLLACSSLDVHPDDKTSIDNLINEWAGEVGTAMEGIGLPSNDYPPVSLEEDILSRIASRVSDNGVKDRKDHDFEAVSYQTNSIGLGPSQLAWDQDAESIKEPTNLRPDWRNSAARPHLPTPVTPERASFFFHELDGGTKAIGLVNRSNEKYIFSF